MALRQEIFWRETVEWPSQHDALDLPETADVAVIGAGFTGLSAARTLTKSGAKVAVLEAESIGWGASSRNGGMVLTGLKLSVETLVKKYGLELAQRMFAASIQSIDCVEQIVKEEKIDCDFTRSGHLVVACKPAHFEEFRRSAEVLARDFRCEERIIEKKDLSSEIGSEIYEGGLVDEASAGVNPARYVAGLARASERAGTSLHENTRVLHVEPDSRNGAKGFRLATSRGQIWARDVFVATSGYTGGATPAMRKRIIPIGSYIIVTERLSEGLSRALSPRNRMIYDSKNFLHYYRLTPDGRMLFGGRAAFFPETPNTIRQSAQILHRSMIQVFPQLENTAVEYVWGGTLDFTFDMLPHSGKLDGLHYAMGYAGHGVAMATYLGAMMAEAIAGRGCENPFSVLPFPGAPLGLYNGKPWFLPFAGAWHKFLDWIR
jgi:glycine/D-amino acid oxidase-like deaminating enzyme